MGEELVSQGQFENAFARALSLQTGALHEDFVWRVCGVRQKPKEVAEVLNMPTRMQLLLSLARHLASSGTNDDTRTSRLDWMTELWFAFKPDDPSVTATAGASCQKLTELLESIDVSTWQDGN